MFFSIKALIFFIFPCAKLLVEGGEMKLKTKVYNGIMYVLLCGELDENSAGYVRDEMDKSFACSGFSRVIIDLSELDFMDSTGIGVLIGRYKKLKDRNIPIFISNPSRHAEKIFRITGLYDIMPKII